MQPAVHDVEHEFIAEIVFFCFDPSTPLRTGPSAFLGGGPSTSLRINLPGRGVGGNADFPGETVGRIAGESDDVGDARIGEKVGMEPGEAGIGQEREGEFAGRAAAEKFPGVGVEGVDERGGRTAIGAQAGMAVVNGDDAHFQKPSSGSDFDNTLLSHL